MKTIIIAVLKTWLEGNQVIKNMIAEKNNNIKQYFICQSSKWKSTKLLRYWNGKSWEKVKDLSIMIKQSEWVMFNPNYLKGSDTSFGCRNMTWGETTGNKYIFFSKLSDFSSNSFYDYVWWWMFLLHNKAWLELSYFKKLFFRLTLWLLFFFAAWYYSVLSNLHDTSFHAGN